MPESSKSTETKETWEETFTRLLNQATALRFGYKRVRAFASLAPMLENAEGERMKYRRWFFEEMNRLRGDDGQTLMHLAARMCPAKGKRMRLPDQALRLMPYVAPTNAMQWLKDAPRFIRAGNPATLKWLHDIAAHGWYIGELKGLLNRYVPEETYQRLMTFDEDWRAALSAVVKNLPRTYEDALSDAQTLDSQAKRAEAIAEANLIYGLLPQEQQSRCDGLVSNEPSRSRNVLTPAYGRKSFEWRKEGNVACVTAHAPASVAPLQVTPGAWRAPGSCHEQRSLLR